MIAQSKVAYLGNSVSAQRNSFIEPLHQFLVTHWDVARRQLKSALSKAGPALCSANAAIRMTCREMGAFRSARVNCWRKQL
jgi:hypothetical protein